jgi:hypothetical protein
MKNKTIILISIGSALLIGAGIFLYLKNRPKKDEKSKTEKEKSEDKSSGDKSSGDKSSNDKAASDKSSADKSSTDKAAAAAADKAAADKAASDTIQPSGFPLKKAIGFNQLAKNLQKGLNKKCNSKLVEDGKFGALTEAALLKCYGVNQADFALYNRIIS